MKYTLKLIDVLQVSLDVCLFSETHLARNTEWQAKAWQKVKFLWMLYSTFHST